jgi:N-acetylmuramoyl-L-alanine amidase
MSAGRIKRGKWTERDPRGIGRVPYAWVLSAMMLLALVLAPRPGMSAGLPEATGLRFGESGPRTRVVVDFDRSVAFAARVESNPDQLLVELGAVDWHLPADAGRPLQGLARGHDITPSRSGGALLTVDMARSVRIVGAILLPPNKDSPKYRLVVDMVADGQDQRGAGDAPKQPTPKAKPTTLAALPTARAVDGAGATCRESSRELPVVVLDPGHGGVDPGATSVGGQYEKDLVLNMAKELRSLIERSGRYRVVLTRDDDEFIRLRDRIAFARKLGGQIFISIHADSLRYTEQRGASIYTLSEQASDVEAASLAAVENKADILTGADLSQHDAVVATILIDLAQRDTNNKSIAFADLMSEQLAKVSPLVKRHRRFAGFAVLKSPDIPSVLLELGYLSNPEDARNLAQPNYRAKLGQAIVRTLDQYFAVPRS